MGDGDAPAKVLASQYFGIADQCEAERSGFVNHIQPIRHDKPIQPPHSPPADTELDVPAFVARIAFDLDAIQFLPITRGAVRRVPR